MAIELEYIKTAIRALASDRNHFSQSAEQRQRITDEYNAAAKWLDDLSASQAKVAELEKELAERDLLEARNSGEIAMLIEIAKHYYELVGRDHPINCELCDKFESIEENNNG